MKNKRKIIVFSAYGIFALVLLVLILFNLLPPFSLLLLIASAGFCYVSMRFYDKDKLKRCTAYVCGKVICVERPSLGSGKRGYHPVIEYVVDGKTYRNRYNLGRSAQYYKQGDDFHLLYNPNDPNEITQEDEDLERASKIYAIVAIVLVALLFVVLFFSIGSAINAHS